MFHSARMSSRAARMMNSADIRIADSSSLNARISLVSTSRMLASQMPITVTVSRPDSSAMALETPKAASMIASTAGSAGSAAARRGAAPAEQVAEQRAGDQADGGGHAQRPKQVGIGLRILFQHDEFEHQQGEDGADRIDDDPFPAQHG